MVKIQFYILTLFPEMFESFLSASIIGRAIKNKKIKVNFVNLRDFGISKHKQVDDTPYGGGNGMVLKIDVVDAALGQLKRKTKNEKRKIILLTPQGKKLNQKLVSSLLAKSDKPDRGAGNTQVSDLILICGHYEGFDERIRELVDEEISIGDYVLTGGEPAAMVLVDALARLVPGVLGKEESAREESFSNGLLEYPQYTRPKEYKGKKVPEVLLSGNHGEIAKWRQKEAKIRTKKRRPDLLE